METRKTVLITGASSGIGAGLALSFAQAGYDVALGCRNQQSVEHSGNRIAAQCAAFGGKALCVTGDVSDFEQAKELVTQTKEQLGRIDVLINNAGITRDGLLPRMKEQDFDDVIASNLKSVFNLCRQVTPLMMKQRKGWIINLSSVVGISGNAGQTNYAASKAGVIGLTKALAKELGGRNIICNAIAPGFVASPMTDALGEDLQKRMLDRIALGRFGTNQDIAEVALFLASTQYVTGQVIVVDGGMAI